MPKWIKKWKVPSSSGNGEYTVALDENGNYGCSCPVWKFRRQECHHIRLIKNGDGEPVKEKPKPVLAMVRKPIYKEQTNELLLPLVALPDLRMMEATICYYLLKYGYSMREVRQIRGHVPSSWTVKAIMNHIEIHGEAEYPESEYRG